MSTDRRTVRVWPARWGWRATVRAHIRGTIGTELDPPWWRPTRRGAVRAASRWIRARERAEARAAASVTVEVDR